MHHINKLIMYRTVLDWWHDISHFQSLENPWSRIKRIFLWISHN